MAFPQQNEFKSVLPTANLDVVINIMHLCLFDLHKCSLQHPFMVNPGIKPQACIVLPSPVTCLDEALHAFM